MIELSRQLVPIVKDHIILSGIVMSAEVEDILLSRDLIVPRWSDSGVKQHLNPAFEQRLKAILSDAAFVTDVSLGP